MTLDDLYDSPDHYLQSFDGDDAIFVPMDRAAYHRSIFLDGRISPAASGSMRIPLATLSGAGRGPAPTAWIFHVAHCGSTLLARALDRPQYNLVLREPLALRQLAITPARERLPLAATMLSRRYQSTLPTIIKANVPVNFLLPDLVALDPDAHAIFLHLTLSDYLTAILRSDNHREWLRRVTAQLAPWIGMMDDRSDAERAAALWLTQVRAYETAIAALPNARSLDAELFFSAPRAVLAAAAAHLGVPLSTAMIDEQVDGPLFATYSKNPSVRFDNDDRLSRRAALLPMLRDEIAEAERWVAGRSDNAFATNAALTAAALLG